MKAAYRVGIKPAEFWRMTPHISGLCVEAYNENERDSREKDLWVEWHNAYLNRVDKMPHLNELLGKKDKPKDDDAPDPNLGRDLMNALLGGFRAEFANKPKPAEPAPSPAEE